MWVIWRRTQASSASNHGVGAGASGSANGDSTLETTVVRTSTSSVLASSGVAVDAKGVVLSAVAGTSTSTRSLTVSVVVSSTVPSAASSTSVSPSRS